MSEFSEVLGSVQQQVLSVVEQSQHLAVGAVSAWGDVVAKALPGPAKLPPGVVLPELKKQFEAGFDFAEQLLGTQRELTAKVLDRLIDSPAGV
jgi:hypothetical protein